MLACLLDEFLGGQCSHESIAGVSTILLHQSLSGGRTHEIVAGIVTDFFRERIVQRAIRRRERSAWGRVEPRKCMRLPGRIANDFRGADNVIHHSLHS